MLTKWTCFTILCLTLGVLPACSQTPAGLTGGDPSAENALLRVRWTNTATALWQYEVKASGSTHAIAPPVFEVDGDTISAVLTEPPVLERSETLSNGASEYVFRGRLAADTTLLLRTTMRMGPDNPVVRFRYRLESTGSHQLTKSAQEDNPGQDYLRYLSTSLADYPTVEEVRLSEFHELPHAYLPTTTNAYDHDFETSQALFGPLLVAHNRTRSLLLAYEHGSQVPDAYLQFRLRPGRKVNLEAVQGNYYRQQPLDGDHPYETLWFHLAVTDAPPDTLAHHYRTFVLQYMSLNLASRQPYIFYNTWNFQERNFAWYGNPYLASMNQKRMLEEIEIAHRMGIEVFVVDAGWFGKTGDWVASSERFPNQLKDVKAKLDSNDMHLGLWFNSKAAVSSEMLARNRDYIISMNGEAEKPEKVWETEESYTMCLVSPFAEDFAEELIRVAQETGVRYFKWDAFDQYGCNAAGHGHGDENTPPEERAQNYSFQLPGKMTQVANKICAAFPDAIVDFDLTEGQRAMGLGFLSAGKYFVFNNGPYYYSFDDSEFAPGGGMGANVFVFPGLARGVAARRTLDYDRWIPSVLTLTHYLPDDPEYSQWINLGSLILGHNGIWGNLPEVSPAGVERFSTVLTKYKNVRQDITASYPVRSGRIGGSPEIHEKINDANGKGAVVIFYNYKNAWNRNPEGKGFAGTFTYVTQHRVASQRWHTENANVTFDEEGRAIITANFEGPGAAIVLFGTD